MRTNELKKIVLHAMEDVKAFDIEVIDVKKLTSITDLMIIASGGSSRQVKAIAEKTLEAVKQHKITLLGAEGIQQGDWALLDLGDVIVHIMRPVIREYYQLEKLWAPESRKTSSM
jgi:ribosome-associated protein